MEKIKPFFKADSFYSAALQSFTIRDSLIAVVYYVLFMAMLYGAGVIFEVSKIYLGIPMSIVGMLIPVAICNHRLASIGINSRNLAPSIIVSCILGGLLCALYTIVPGIIHHRQLLPLKDIAYNIFFYFAIIGLSEEISFRGFIQPRLMPLLKREWLAIILGGILFVFMHYPFQMAARNMTFLKYWPLFIANAPFQFMWHLAFTWLYRRYGNIFGSTILHGFLNLSEGIFVG